MRCSILTECTDLYQERAKAVELLEKMEGLDCVFPEPGGAWLREMSRNTSIDVANLEGDAFLSALGDFLAGPGYEFRQNVLVDTGGVVNSSPFLQSAACRRSLSAVWA